VIATFEHVAKWYGQVIGLVDADVAIGPGVTGLLGPNGAGKSTFLKLLTGQLQPSQGQVRLFGVDPFRTTRMHGRVGFLPEPDAFYEEWTGRAFVRFLTRLHGFARKEARRRADAALEQVGLGDVGSRRVRTYSKGMRQRLKLAQALAHEPDLLVLDEPLTGMDPVWRRRTMDLVRRLGESGVAVVVSSHILHEVEAMTDTFVLLYQGRVRASGSREEIRAYLSEVPHRIRIRSPRARPLAQALLEFDGVTGVRLADGGLRVETTKPDELFDRLPGLVLDGELPVEALEEEDADLDAIFGYLVP